MNFVIQINTGSGAGQDIVVSPGQTIVFGRGDDADKTFDDSQMSGTHFVIDYLANACMIRDLDSTNGTTLNGLRVVEAQLNVGDNIIAGQTSFSIGAHDESNQKKATPPIASGFSSSIGGGQPIPGAPQNVRSDVPTEKFAPPADNPFSSSIFADQPAVPTASEHVHHVDNPGSESFSQSISGVGTDDQMLINADFSTSIVVAEPVTSQSELPIQPVDQSPVLEIFRGLAQPLYAILDAARDPMVLPLLMQSDLKYQSLYEGIKGQELLAVAPYLVHLPPGNELLEKLVERWGESWGIYLTSNASFKKIRQHLQRFLIVRLDDGKNVFFRFYDPRVLRVYLPTCTPEETETLIGPLDCLYFEGEDLEVLDCRKKTLTN